MPLIGYVLLTHGPKHTPIPLRRRPGAGGQMDVVERLADLAEGSVADWVFDYARRPKGAESLAILFKALQYAQEKRHVIAVSDFERLFRKLPADARRQMLGAIDPYREIIFDASRGRALANFKQWEAHAVLHAGLNAPGRREAPRARPAGKADPAPTAKAREVSARARARAADGLAQEIASLRDELAKAGVALNNSELARQANERGLQTSRGKPYTDVAVSRALKRVDRKQSGD